jgi:hypothetical protein
MLKMILIQLFFRALKPIRLMGQKLKFGFEKKITSNHQQFTKLGLMPLSFGKNMYLDGTYL